MCADICIHDKKDGNTANSYHEAYITEITLYEAAERYLKGVLQERFDPKNLPPVAKWTVERRQADRRAQRLKSAVQRAQRRGERSRANPQKYLQYSAAGTTGTATAQDAGYWAVIIIQFTK